LDPCCRWWPDQMILDAQRWSRSAHRTEYLVCRIRIHGRQIDTGWISSCGAAHTAIQRVDGSWLQHRLRLCPTGRGGDVLPPRPEAPGRLERLVLRRILRDLRSSQLGTRASSAPPTVGRAVREQPIQRPSSERKARAGFVKQFGPVSSRIFAPLVGRVGGSIAAALSSSPGASRHDVCS
jgi:hypothetical protein